MALPDLTGTLTITAPSSVDGRGGVAVLNDTTSSDFVGYLLGVSGFDGPAVRVSQDNVPEGHGAVFGSFYHGPRSFTLEVLMAPSSTWTLSNTRLDKLYRATNAMAANASLTWAESGITKLLNFRREQPPRGPDADRKVLISAIASDPRIYANTAQTGSSPKTNNGTIGSPPTFTLTPTGGDVVITNTTGGYGSPALTLTVAAGYLTTTDGAVTVDFGAKTVTQGGVRKDGAVQFPGSTWWEVIPGANTWTVTNASSVSISFRDAWL